ncbi:SDR family NAD(P)-dependent oxidoreductase [Bacteroides heparinolyticus]|uniref:SDR family NAD(P)-dependent oxidoreductase n=1 Tax=Prevotella heparinolytica TaxID=28113 RepID=UPI0023F1E4E5|nr:SDR family oxidoreductase [Bacteroides heparinolyticus]
MELLKDRIAIITGASRGIGRAIAELFAAEGATIYAMDIRDDNLEWTNGNENVNGLVLDICDFTKVKESVMAIKKEHGKIDILVNNAGLISYEMMSMIDYDKFRKMIDVNVVSLIHLMQLVARVMSRQQSGSIINMASMVAVKGVVGQLSYAATKGAVISATKSAAKELANDHIRVNAIAPGMVGTERFKAVLEEKFSQKINDIPFGRLAEPKDIANAALYLASDMSSYVTGQVLGVDGAAVI